MTDRDMDEKQKRKNQGQKSDHYLGCLSKRHLIMASVAVGLVILLIIIIVLAVVLSSKSVSAPPTFSTGGDMLDYLVQSGDLTEPDGLFATWFHRANSLDDMNKALASDAMILEADVTLHAYGTPDEKPIPIMAHFPDIISDNSLDNWLDAVLASKKGMKLDFKALESVGLSLDLLSQKNSNTPINRPVWLNADIVLGPNVPSFVPPVNGTRFLELIQEKFPDATLSPGWKVAYTPPFFTATYTRAMVEEMYNMIKDVPQKVTFPVHALLVRSGWQHLHWILSQSERFSLTLWQGSIHPNVSDLLFVRHNTEPSRVYYDIYEPTLSEFKEAAGHPNQVRRFYPGGDLLDFLYSTNYPGTKLSPAAAQHSSLAVRWFTVSDRSSLLARLSDENGGMLILHVASHSNQPDVPLVEGSGSSSDPLLLQDVLELLEQNPNAPWGVYLRIHTHQLLEASLNLLQSAYSTENLYRPVWISMEGLQSSESTEDFVSTVERLFPYVTLVFAEQNWPPMIPSALTGLSQRVAVHLNAASLIKGQEQLHLLTGLMDKYDFVVETETNSDAELFTLLKGLMAQRTGRANTNLYVISNMS